ncbi:putative membrane protein [Duffyella gerundensis]|uniref:Putative membrane protein n=1 Tax=Duffyella gerundensis TaxID=1619313 RepID=A0A0U5L2L4_9GAMM|nr:putative membrane protein [Duffyella gerundensis]
MIVLLIVSSLISQCLIVKTLCDFIFLMIFIAPKNNKLPRIK